MTNETHAAFPNALDMAAKVDVQFENNLETIFKGKEAVVGGPVLMLSEMKRLFGDDTLATFPIPDSEWNPNANHLTDKYERKVSGKEKPLKGSWYADFYVGTHAGMEIDNQIKAIQEARKEEKGTVPQKYAHFKSMTAVERTAEENRLRQRKTTGTRMVKRAMQVFFQMLHISEALPKVGVMFMTNEDGSFFHTPNPIIVYNVNKQIEAKAVTVGTFLSYDVEQAKADGGTVQDLWATTGKGADDDDNAGEGDADFNITVKTFDDLMAAMANFFEAGKGVNGVTLRTAMKTWDDHSVLSFGDTVAELNAIYTSEEFQKRYVPLATNTKAVANG